MAIDPNKKFLYFNKDGTSGEMDDALCFPISSFIGAETQAASIIDFHFKGSKGTDATVVRGYIDTGFINIKTFYKKFVDQINFGEIAFIKVTDYAERHTHQSDVTFAMTADVVPTFTLQDTDFKVSDSISIGGHSVNDIDITNEFVDSDEHLMTSKAINARIAAAGGGVSVSDSNANTAFPIVFHDEANTLHDDTGAFTYNPFTGLLTSGKGTITSLGTNALTVDTSINLGHASDTTLARSAAGTVTIEGNQIVTAGAVSVASGSQTAVGVQIARRTITQGEANAMDSTPIELIPAQGANTVIVILGGMIRVDRAATQTSALVTLHFHYEGEEPGTYAQSLLYHHRRFMYNETTDRVFHVCPALGTGGDEVADSLTEDVNAAVEASFSSAITNNSVNSIDVYLNYQVIDIS